jgi:hypothetical protein
LHKCHHAAYLQTRFGYVVRADPNDKDLRACHNKCNSREHHCHNTGDEQPYVAQILVSGIKTRRFMILRTERPYYG